MIANVFSIDVPDERIKRFIYLHKIHKPNSNKIIGHEKQIEIPVAQENLINFIQYESTVLFGCNITLYALCIGLGMSMYSIHLTINLIFKKY